MTEKYKDTETTFDISSCMEMMQKMMGKHMEGCGCGDMMSQVTSQEGFPEEWRKVMSQMMDFHCGPQEEPEKGGYEA